MIDWLFEPASNWLVLLGFAWVLLFLWSKDYNDGRRFKFIADALARMPTTDQREGRWGDKI